MNYEWQKDDILKGSCPLCEGVMVVRANRNTGSLFVGCKSYPSCRMNRPLKPSDVPDQGATPTMAMNVHPEVAPSIDDLPPDDDPDPFETQARQYTGTLCSVCREKQFDTPHGVVCANGHGGAEPVLPEDPMDSPTDLEYQAGGQTMELQSVDRGVVAGRARDAARVTSFKEAYGSDPLHLCMSEVFDKESSHHVTIDLSVTDQATGEIKELGQLTIAFDKTLAAAKQANLENIPAAIVGRALPGLLELFEGVFE